MLHLYSKACEYAISALANLSEEESKSKFTVKMLCCQPHIRESYTRKAFQQLSQARILKAITGPGGGYRLAKKINQITLANIIQGIDGSDCFNQCVLGRSQCNDKQSCPMHETWKPLKQKMIKTLTSVTLKDLIKLKNRS